MCCQYGQFCGKEDKEKFEADFCSASHDSPEHSDAVTGGRCNSNASMDSATQALLLHPTKNSNASSQMSASSNGSGSQASSSNGQISVKRDPGATRVQPKRAASQHIQGPIKKAPKLDIPEHGLHPGIQVLCVVKARGTCFIFSPLLPVQKVSSRFTISRA